MDRSVLLKFEAAMAICLIASSNMLVESNLAPIPNQEKEKKKRMLVNSVFGAL